MARPSAAAAPRCAAGQRLPAGYITLMPVHPAFFISLSSAPLLHSPLAAGMGLSSSAFCSAVASLSGVWPPNCTMMPSGRSFSITFSTSSTWGICRGAGEAGQGLCDKAL